MLNVKQQEFVALWVKALRSGKYRQGIGVLKMVDTVNGARYCCLGVLCEIAGISGVLTKRRTRIDVVEFGPWPSKEGVSQDKAYFLPHPSWFREATGLFVVDMISLSNLNDRGRSFGEIADKIEELVKA